MGVVSDDLSFLAAVGAVKVAVIIGKLESSFQSSEKQQSAWIFWKHGDCTYGLAHQLWQHATRISNGSMIYHVDVLFPTLHSRSAAL